ncbi:MAG TPA: NPCBM/NEW2 domain-containing protein [Isosphaeraceae bacterium]|jgi:hypothetical protein|nr:NPCBM/NEW2 domain-containing protein [Isosphaeraceae bacterium]
MSARRLLLATVASSALLTCVSSARSAAGEKPDKPGSTVPSEPVFAALLIDGTTVSGRIQKLGPGGEIVLENGEERTLPLRRLVKLSREGSPPPFPPEGSTLALFPEGDRLRAVIGSAGETALETRSYILGDVSIPLDALLGLVLAPPTEPEEFEDLLGRVREQPRTTEVLWLANGDRLSGGFLGLTPRQVSFQPEGGQVSIDRSQVVALGFDPKLVDYPRPKGDYFELTLADGSRFGVSDLKIEKGQVEATSRFGAAIKLAIGDLSRIHMRNPSVIYLSERKPDEAAYVTYVGPSRPYRRDAAVDGHCLRLASEPYDRGLGTQSRTLLAYRLSPSDHRFQATVGLDDRAGPLGSVVFRVSVDGQDRFVSPPMSLRDPPRPIDIDVAGAKALILVTEFGERGEVRDFADWVEARLIR